jgi:NAD(P)-dependent dehydrogenase (short-subunit alcohol dehydrogenase family)
MFNFTNQIIMITGASGNLGTAVARAFYESSGRLALIDRNEDLVRKAFPELVDSPDCFMTSCADLTNPDEVNKTISTWNFMMDLNARTVFIITQAVVPHMIRQGSGKIVHLAARPGLQGRANMSAYSASKAAVIRLIESASAEVKDQGINVNCILPGTLDTPQNRKATPDADFSRWVTTESLAQVILFLCSDASIDIHGAAIPVYGRT